MPTCPNGHQSGSDDWCEVCGHRMAGAVPPPPPPPPAGGYGFPPPQGTQAGGRPPAASAAEPELCPQCRTPREGGAPFCEECRWNFLTNTATSYTPAAPRPPQPRFQPPSATYGGNDGYEYQGSRPSQMNRPAEPIPSFGSEPSGPTPFAAERGPSGPPTSPGPSGSSGPSGFGGDGRPPGPPPGFGGQGQGSGGPSGFGGGPGQGGPGSGGPSGFGGDRGPGSGGPSGFGGGPGQGGPGSGGPSGPSGFGGGQGGPSGPPPFGREPAGPGVPPGPQGFGGDPSRPVPPPPGPTPPAGPGAGPGGAPQAYQQSAPPAPPAFPRETGRPPGGAPSGGPSFGGEDDWVISPPSSGPGGGQGGGGYGYPQPGATQAPPGGPGFPQQPAGPVTWTATIGPDRDYFMAMMQRSGPEAAGLNLPAYSPEQQRTLSGNQVTIGRRRHSTGDTPDIDLAVPPEDPGVSHQHAVLVQQPDGSWAVVDQNSTNGTTVNMSEEPIQPFVPVPLQDGDRVHVGAWTTITIRRA
ncbi:phosphopeptide-binding protein [Streptomyces incarnatus]|uniref:Phosphopeptide-binding protein n=1 Tax=Streptomyces incarnatus TaxID=665007 RepID=A0ABM5TPZ9_9ACTN|nr:FHA domain-containing protein [Streptomyces incarnatus]AKJ13121.1 phosphopeptide-binding protein [Streptomyces incarnatus]